DSDEAELVTLLIAERGHRAPHIRSGSDHPRPGAELEDEQSSKRTHRAQAYKPRCERTRSARGRVIPRPPLLHARLTRLGRTAGREWAAPCRGAVAAVPSTADAAAPLRLRGARSSETTRAMHP